MRPTPRGYAPPSLSMTCSSNAIKFSPEHAAIRVRATVVYARPVAPPSQASEPPYLSEGGSRPTHDGVVVPVAPPDEDGAVAASSSTPSAQGSSSLLSQLFARLPNVVIRAATGRLLVHTPAASVAPHSDTAPAAQAPNDDPRFGVALDGLPAPLAVSTAVLQRVVSHGECELTASAEGGPLKEGGAPSLQRLTSGDRSAEGSPVSAADCSHMVPSVAASSCIGLVGDADSTSLRVVSPSRGGSSSSSGGSGSGEFPPGAEGAGAMAAATSAPQPAPAQLAVATAGLGAALHFYSGRHLLPQHAGEVLSSLGHQPLSSLAYQQPHSPPPAASGDTASHSASYSPRLPADGGGSGGLSALLKHSSHGGGSRHSSADTHHHQHHHHHHQQQQHPHHSHGSVGPATTAGGAAGPAYDADIEHSRVGDEALAAHSGGASGSYSTRHSSLPVDCGGTGLQPPTRPSSSPAALLSVGAQPAPPPPSTPPRLLTRDGRFLSGMSSLSPHGGGARGMAAGGGSSCYSQHHQMGGGGLCAREHTGGSHLYAARADTAGGGTQPQNGSLSPHTGGVGHTLGALSSAPHGMGTVGQTYSPQPSQGHTHTGGGGVRVSTTAPLTSPYASLASPSFASFASGGSYPQQQQHGGVSAASGSSVGAGGGGGARRVAMLRVAVTDRGIGISREEQTLLFKPFNQIRAGSAQKGGGTGLGLSICKRIVELAGGHVGVVSKPGRGSTFYLDVPLVTHAPTAPAAVAAAVLATPLLRPTAHAADGLLRMPSLGTGGVGNSPPLQLDQHHHATPPRRGSQWLLASPAPGVGSVLTFTAVEAASVTAAASPRTAAALRPPAPGAPAPAAPPELHRLPWPGVGYADDAAALVIKPATALRSPLDAAPSRGRAGSAADGVVPQVPPGGPARSGVGTQPPTTPPLTRLTCALVVDDVRSNRELLSRLLQRKGVAHVATCDDGSAAVHAVASLLAAARGLPLAALLDPTVVGAATAAVLAARRRELDAADEETGLLRARPDGSAAAEAGGSAVSPRVAVTAEGDDSAAGLLAAGGAPAHARQLRPPAPLLLPRVPQVVLLDGQMPVLDGHGAATALRAMGFTGAIVGVSGNALAEDVAAFVAAGADSVVVKPVRLAMLEAQLAAVGLALGAGGGGGGAAA